MEKMLASSKLDMEETANRIKDRRYTIEDQIRLSSMTLENAERVMRAYNRSLGMAAERLAGMSIDELLQFEPSGSVRYVPSGRVKHHLYVILVYYQFEYVVVFVFLSIDATAFKMSPRKICDMFNSRLDLV